MLYLQIFLSQTLIQYSKYTVLHEKRFVPFFEK